jgi:glycosyltransferase involved in cell wall biosynthesis
MPDHVNRLKLNLITEYFHPANNAPSARFKPLVDSLLATSIDVVVYTSNISSHLKHYNIKTNFFDFPSNQKSAFIRLIKEFFFGIETFVRLLTSSGDLYYITSPSFINCSMAFFYCRLFNRKYILDIRDDYPRVYVESGLLSQDGIATKVLTWLGKKMFNHAYIIVAATNGLKSNIQRQSKKDIWLLRNGYSEKLFFPSIEKYERFTIVFHGIISTYQDIDLLIHIGKLIDDQKLKIDILVIGQGNQAYKLKGHDVPSSIIYLGPQPYEEIPRLINRAHLGLSFRKIGKISEDSFPVKTYEYIGVSVPIIVTPLSEAGEYVSKHNIGYQFNPTDTVELMSKILELSENQNLYGQLLHNIARIRPYFSRERISSEFVDYLLTKHTGSRKFTS